jgi:hypothetical protein
MRKAIIIAVQLVCLGVYAQKVDLDRFYFSAAYRDLPRTPLDTSYHTFSVSAQTGPLSKLVLKPVDLEQRVSMDGWRRITSGAHLLVDFRFDDVIIEQTGVKENVEVLKDKNGKETGKRSTYVMQVTYTYGAQAKLTDYRGQSVASFTFATRDEKRVYNSESFLTSAEANAYMRFGLLVITNELIKQSSNEAVNSLNATLTLNYGYPDRVVNDFFWLLNSRKHPEYENAHRAWITFKQAITNMRPDEPLDQVKADMKPVIDYFNSVKKKYNSNSKADKKLRYASYYNLAKIYWYLDDPDAGINEANELEINGFDSKDAYGLENGATNLKEQLRSAKRDSRHFKLNVDEYQGIGSIGNRQ